MLPSPRVMENRARFSRERSQVSPGLRRGQQRRARDAARQTGSHWSELHPTKIFQWAQCLLYPSEKPSVLHQKVAVLLLCPPLTDKSPRATLAKRTTEKGLVEGERTNGVLIPGTPYW